MLKAIVRNLRLHQTLAEKFLWRQLRNRTFANYKFRRQVQIQNYIVDFVCFEKQFIIEIDDSQHQLNKNYNDKRTAELQRLGYRVIRFWNNDVFKNLEQVLAAIYDALDEY